MNKKNEKLWFKRKLYGWGWYPASKEGWAVVIAYLVIGIALGLTIDENSSNSEIMFVFFLPVTLLTITLIRICYKKGETPRWQWGKRKKD